MYSNFKIFQDFSQTQVYVYCSGKCGGSTLKNTLKDHFNSIHLHSNYCFTEDLKYNFSAFECIEQSMKNFEEIYIIDSYRLPIERAISAFFQNITIHVPDYENKSVEDLIKIFNENYIMHENYNSLDEIYTYFNIMIPDKFNFDAKYNHTKYKNVNIIKLRFNDINNWSSILSNIFNKDITILDDNLSINKSYYSLYKEFLEKYTISETNFHFFINEQRFLTYNTPDEQKLYIEKFANKIC